MVSTRLKRNMKVREMLFAEIEKMKPGDIFHSAEWCKIYNTSPKSIGSFIQENKKARPLKRSDAGNLWVRI
jgi:hypothetical protein